MNFITDRFLFVLSVILLIIIVPLSARAEFVFTKDGAITKCSIVRESAGTITIRDEKKNVTTISRVNGYNVNLKNLKVSSGTLCPLFFPEKKGYNLEVEGGTSTLDITPEVADSSSTVTVNNEKIAAGETFTAPLEPGQNLFSIKVTAADGITVREYNLSVNRLKAK